MRGFLFRMMIRLFPAVLALSWASAFAQEGALTRAPAKRVEDVAAGTTVVGKKKLDQGYLADETFGVKPQLGAIWFSDSTGNRTSRLAGGLAIDVNLLSVLSKKAGKAYLGFSSGILYSHLGAASSSFLGTNPEDKEAQLQEAGSNLVVIPLNLKIGYSVGTRLRLSVHGGGNSSYRSVAKSMSMGSSSSGHGSVWRIFPNAGADVEVGFGKSMAILLRPDVTFTSNQSVLTGTLGLGISLD